MGKGPTGKSTVLTHAAALAASAGGADVSPCAEQRPITIDLVPGAVARIGDQLAITPGRPPAATIGSRHVGTVAPIDAADIEGCISFGYRFSGAITDVDLPTASAVALVRGSKG
jgi:hypothetical protein